MTMFKERTTRPEKGNKYYITKDAGGWSSAIKGKPTDSQNNVLHNCVGYAYGRFNEIAETGSAMSYLEPRNAELWAGIAKNQGLDISQTPEVGAVMCWQKGATLNSSDGAGHVAIVEKVISPTEVITSESGYNAKNAWWRQTRKTGTDGRWGQNSYYTFLGFIRNPAVRAEANTSSPVLKRGSKGEDVKTLQNLLKEKKYYCGNIDGDFGNYTFCAVAGFQLDNNLVIDGICGPATWAALRR